MFLIPRTLKVGAITLLIVFAGVLVVHGVQSELTILIYAAGVLFVRILGSAYSRDILRRQRTAA